MFTALTVFFFSSRRRHTSCALVTGVQTCALPISLFPDATRPNFGVFVERQTLGLAAHAGVDLRLIAPVGLPPWPLTRHPRYRALAALPRQDRKSTRLNSSH